MWNAGSLHRLCLLIMALSLTVLSCSTPSGGGGGDDGNDNGGQDNGGGGGGAGDDDLIPQPDTEPFPGSDRIMGIFREPQLYYGAVELPAGFALTFSDLKIVTLVGDVALNDDGTFQNGEMNVPSGTRTLTAVTDSQDRVVLLGHAYPIDNTRNPFNTESTAVALLYFAMGGWTTPQEAFDDIYSTIRYDYADSVALVTAALDAALADNPAALAEGDERISSAIQEAVDILLAGATAKTTGAAASDAKWVSTNLQSASVVGFIAAAPGQTTVQNGMYLRSDTTTGGLFGVNTLPRRGRILTYKTAYESGGQRTDLLPVEKVGIPITVPSAYTTGGSGGLLSNLTTHLEGGFPWRRIESDVFGLDMHDGANVTYYDVLLLSSTLDNVAPSSLFQDPKYALEDATWMAELTDLQIETFYLDYMIPVMEVLAIGASLLPEDAPDVPFVDESNVANPTVGSMTTVLGLPDATRIAMLTEARTLCDPVVSGISLATAQGYSDALVAILARAGTDGTFRAALTDILYRAYGPSNNALISFSRMQQNLLNMASTFAITAAVQYGIGKISLGGVTEHLQQSMDITRWTATLSNVRLLPSSPVVTEKYPIESLSAQVNVASGAQLCYRWSTTGNIAVLVGSETNDQGTMFSSSGNTCDYVADPGAISKTPSLDTVTVDVFEMSGVGGNGNCDANATSGFLLGSASVTIAGDERDDACQSTSFNPDLYNPPGPITLEVSPRTVLPGSTVTVTINYDFSAPGADPSSFAGVSLYLPLGCSFCWNPERRCLCDQGDRATLTLDGNSSPANVSTTEFVTGISGDVSDPNFRPLRSNCLNGISPLYFSLPDPEVREVVTHTVEYRISPDFTPCPLEQPDCHCPRLIQEPVFVSTGLVWTGPFVIADESGSGSLAVELLNMGTDPAYDPETHVTCPTEE